MALRQVEIVSVNGEGLTVQVDFPTGAETIKIRGFPIKPDGSPMTNVEMVAWITDKLNSLLVPVLRRKASISNLDTKVGRNFTVDLDV